MWSLCVRALYTKVELITLKTKRKEKTRTDLEARVCRCRAAPKACAWGAGGRGEDNKKSRLVHLLYMLYTRVYTQTDGRAPVSVTFKT